MSDKLMLTKSALEAPKTLGEVFDLPAFRDAFATNYLKTTGKDGGEMIFEKEKILFMKLLQDNKKLAECDRFTVYSSFVELAVSGLSLQDGQTFIIPYGKKAQFQVGWKGRLEQIQQIPIVKFVNTPILVWESEVEQDRFDYEYIEGATVIKKHKPILKRPEDDIILFVYCTLDTTEGSKTYLMDRETILSIRDRYSQSYKLYIAACLETKTEIGKPVTKTGQYGPYTIDPPFWVTDEAQAFKKTLVKRIYSEVPKTARMKALDAKIATNFDPEDATGGEQNTEEINYGIVDDQPKTLPQRTEQSSNTNQAAPRTRKASAPINESSQVKEIKAAAEPLKQAMREKGQLPPEEPEPNTQDVSHKEVTEEDNPIAGLPDLNNI